MSTNRTLLKDLETHQTKVAEQIARAKERAQKAAADKEHRAAEVKARIALAEEEDRIAREKAKAAQEEALKIQAKNTQKKLTKQKTKFETFITIVRATFSDLGNVCDILLRYAGLSSTAASFANIGSIFPLIVLGPIAVMFNIFCLLYLNDKPINLSSILNTFGMSSSSTLGFAAAFAHSIAIPLVIASASVNFVKESWGLIELLINKYYYKEPVSSAKINLAIHDVILAGISVAGAVCLLFPPLMPLGYLIFGLLATYRLIDALGYNPLKKYTNWFKEEEPAKSESEERPKTTLVVASTLQADDKAGLAVPEQKETKEKTLTQKTESTPWHLRHSRFARFNFGKLNPATSIVALEQSSPAATSGSPTGPSHRNGTL